MEGYRNLQSLPGSFSFSDVNCWTSLLNVAARIIIFSLDSSFTRMMFFLLSAGSSQMLTSSASASLAISKENIRGCTFVICSSWEVIDNCNFWVSFVVINDRCRLFEYASQKWLTYVWTENFFMSNSSLANSQQSKQPALCITSLLVWCELTMCLNFNPTFHWGLLFNDIYDWSIAFVFQVFSNEL